MRLLLSVLFVQCALLPINAFAQVPALPEGARSAWVVKNPEEIVGYLVFNPTTVKDRLPSSMRFITLGDLASGKIQWAEEHLDDYPQHFSWGISFVEIVRMGTFQIDGKSPQWPENGAASLWFARVASTDPNNELGPGRAFLALEFWIPDREYVAYMRKRGHFASYGDTRLHRTSKGQWLGSIRVDGLRLTCECTPGEIVRRSGSGGAQVFYSSALQSKSVVRVAFAGHMERTCLEDSVWAIEGEHPLADGVMLKPSTLQYGYELVGGAYEH